MRKRKFSEINSIAIPLIVSAMTATFLALMDQAIIGHISIYAFAGVSLVISVINAITGVLGVLAVSYNILGSKSKGNGDISDVNGKFTVCIIISILIGMFFVIILFFGGEFILSAFFGLTGQALDESVNFIKIYSFTVGLNLIIFIYNTTFKIFKQTVTILKVSLVVNIIGVVLDYVLVYGKLGFKPLGSTGAAIGTVVALALNVLIYYFYGRKTIKLNIKIKSIKKQIQGLIKLSIPLFLDDFLEDVLFILGINMIIARIGVAELSTYSLMLSVFNILLMPMFAYSSASMTLISEKSGNGKQYICGKISKEAIRTALIIYIIASLVAFALSGVIPLLITNSQTLADSFKIYILPCIIINIFNIIKTIYKAGLQSIGNEKWVVKENLFANVATLLLILLLSRFGLTAVYLLLGTNYLYLSIRFYYKQKSLI